jgi:phosphate transport system protein
MVESAIIDSVNVLKKRDMDGSRQLIEADEGINKKRFAIEHDTLTLIATQQPMAGDMRTLASVFLAWPRKPETCSAVHYMPSFTEM